MSNEQLSENEHPSDNSELRIDIIKAVKTPLGFFTLLVLVTESLFGGGYNQRCFSYSLLYNTRIYSNT
jgi:hypothetical protein